MSVQLVGQDVGVVIVDERDHTDGLAALLAPTPAHHLGPQQITDELAPIAIPLPHTQTVARA